MKSMQQTWGLPFGDRPVLDFEAGASQIEILPVEGGAFPRIESRHALFPLEVRQVGEAVTVRLSTPVPHARGGVIDSAVSMLLGAAAGGGEFRLHLPAHVKAHISAHMGQVKVRGLAGCWLEVETSAGQLVLDDCRGRFDLRAKAGQIVGRRLGGTFHIESGAGEAVLDIVQLDEGRHTVHSSMGSVKVELAPGLNVRIDSRTVMGSTRTRYPSQADAKAVLQLEAELGAVKVKEGSAYQGARDGGWPDWQKLWAAAAPPAPDEPRDELMQILALVQQKKLSPEEADRLIAAL